MSVTLHTNLGDVKIEIFCDTVPRTAFNFLALAGSGYYDHSLFHRNIRGFMLQGGDPSGTGKGGESIWGGKFADEIHPANTHSARGIVSMANSVCSASMRCKCADSATDLVSVSLIIADAAHRRVPGQTARNSS
jgi:cyclophilin family peptidyl-prolyl cis-trans isomerase